MAIAWRYNAGIAHLCFADFRETFVAQRVIDVEPICSLLRC